MLKLAHKLEWMGKGQYRCVNCGGETKKKGVADFMKQKCPGLPDYASIAEDVAKIFEKTEAVAQKLDELKALVISLKPEVKP
ncbi:hypothetical protein ES703_70986 [subsurface metagenome]